MDALYRKGKGKGKGKRGKDYGGSTADSGKGNQQSSGLAGPRPFAPPPPGEKDMRVCRWCLKTGHVMKDCRAKQSGKPKAVKGANSLERSHAPAAADWYEDQRQDRDAGSLLRECGTLECDFELDGQEFGGQDWIEDDEEEYDESFVPSAGFPHRVVQEIRPPANGFVPSGPRITS